MSAPRRRPRWRLVCASDSTLLLACLVSLLSARPASGDSSQACQDWIRQLCGSVGLSRCGLCGLWCAGPLLQCSELPDRAAPHRAQREPPGKLRSFRRRSAAALSLTSSRTLRIRDLLPQGRSRARAWPARHRRPARTPRTPVAHSCQSQCSPGCALRLRSNARALRPRR